MRHAIFLLGFVFVSPALAAEARPSISLDVFLRQVETGNLGVRAATEASRGAVLRAAEADLLLAPTLFGSFQTLNDKKPSAFFPFPQTINNGYTLGIQKLFSFGLQAKLQYGFNYVSYPTFRPPFYEGRPEISITQPLWRNRFGSETRANREAIEASALANRYAQSFQRKASLAEAEGTYWRYAVANENLTVQKSALQRSQKIHDWSARRAKFNLSDPSDLYQAQAALQIAKLRVQASEDESRSAARAFNQARGFESDEVAENVDVLTIESIASLNVPAREGNRDDVRAAEQASRIAVASATASIDKNSPSLDAYATYAWNSQQSTLSDGLRESLNADKRTIVVGVKFSAPLNFGALSDSKAGLGKERDAAELTYQRRLFDQEKDWRELTERFENAKRRLLLSQAVEATQGRKLRHERDRQETGRTTTYQVLIFEQDFAQSELSRIQAQAEVLTLYARLKIYSTDASQLTPSAPSTPGSAL